VHFRGHDARRSMANCGADFCCQSQIPLRIARSGTPGTVVHRSGTKYEHYQYCLVLVLDLDRAFLNTCVVLTLAQRKIVSGVTTFGSAAGQRSPHRRAEK
jgi:hypothetical protein